MFVLIFRYLIVVAALACVTGCVVPSGVLETAAGLTIISPDAVGDTAADVVGFGDPHEGWVRISGPMVYEALGDPPTAYSVQTAVDPANPGREDQFRIAIAGYFPKRVYLKEVFTEGRSLRAKVHDRERVDCGPGCAVVEKLFITISEQDMIEWSSTGLPFKVVGRRAQFSMVIPAVYFQAVLARHRAVSRKLGLRDVGNKSGGAIAGI